jgi:hypothetical protein
MNAGAGMNPSANLEPLQWRMYQQPSERRGMRIRFQTVKDEVSMWAALNTIEPGDQERLVGLCSLGVRFGKLRSDECACA